MAKRKQTTDLHQWVCGQLADFYEQSLKPSDLLAVNPRQHDVVVIGPDGRKFRLQNIPQCESMVNVGELEKAV